MKRTVALAALFILATCGAASAHFGMVIPSDNMVAQDEARKISLALSFSHPFEMVGMDLVKPKAFTVLADGKTQDLLPALKETKIMGHPAWNAEFEVKRPGASIFFMEPKPYWEPAEDCYIVHLTKTVVAAFGDDTGWDAELGVEAEIVPLAKPLALWAGNVFQGVVKKGGKPVPFAEVEVEFYNKDKKAAAPSDLMVTQTVKADANGVFTYAAPGPGWWGFAALLEGDRKIEREGRKKDVEIGAVLWVRFEEWKK
jgi:cobalt/nickel transport protein